MDFHVGITKNISIHGRWRWDIFISLNVSFTLGPWTQLVPVVVEPEKDYYERYTREVKGKDKVTPFHLATVDLTWGEANDDVHEGKDEDEDDDEDEGAHGDGQEEIFPQMQSDCEQQCRRKMKKKKKKEKKEDGEEYFLDGQLLFMSHERGKSRTNVHVIAR